MSELVHIGFGSIVALNRVVASSVSLLRARVKVLELMSVIEGSLRYQERQNEKLRKLE